MFLYQSSTATPKESERQPTTKREEEGRKEGRGVVVVEDQNKNSAATKTV